MKKTSRLSYPLAISLLLGSAPAWAQSLEERVERLERTLNSSALIEMVNDNQKLRRTLQTLQGEVELLRRDVDEIQEHQRELFADIDRRLRELETAPPALTPAPIAPMAPTDDELSEDSTEADETSSTPEQTASQGDELLDYQAAFALLKAGSYARATEAFQAFLQSYPEGRYADNALYWLGESYYVVRDFEQALPQFQRVVEEHPASPKRPDALLKIGFIYHEQGKLDQARATLQQVIDDFGDTTAAALAKQRLNRL